MIGAFKVQTKCTQIFAFLTIPHRKSIEIAHLLSYSHVNYMRNIPNTHTTPKGKSLRFVQKKEKKKLNNPDRGGADESVFAPNKFTHAN